MSHVDVSELARDALPPGHFPAAGRTDFRLHFAPDVLRGIAAHAKADDAVEICGVLVGGWEQDDGGPFARVTDYIRCDNAASKFAEVTFTHESWAQINKEMDTKYADKRIVGWYHSHPDFGIFLSDRDCFIQQHFFSGAGQVAYVIDPVRDLEGVFVWRRGKPAPLPHFWAGDEVRVSQPADGARRHEGRAAAPAMSPEGAGAPPSADRAQPSFLMTALAWLSLFLLGYLYSGMLSRWERQQLVEGTVAHFTNLKVLKLGLDKDLEAVRTVLAALAPEFDKLPAPGAKLSKEQATQAAKITRLISDQLAVCQQALARIQDRYALSAEEQAALARVLAEQQAMLRAVTPQTGSGGAGASGAARPDPTGPAPQSPPPAAPPAQPEDEAEAEPAGPPGDGSSAAD